MYYILDDLMRSADAVSLFRIPLLLFVLGLIVIKATALLVTSLIAALFALDWVDGFLAKRSGQKIPRYGAYLDIAVDRAIEYAFWLAFTFLLAIPWFVFAIVFVRNMLADALVLRKGKTFSKMGTAFGKIASSHLSRGAYAILKAVNFAYLSLVFVSGWPAGIGYVLIALTVAFSLARGAAEIYESLL